MDQLGDENNRYFYSMIKHKKLQHAIIQLRDKYNCLQTEQEAIADILVDYYKELWGKKERHRIKAFNSILRRGQTLAIEQQLELIQPYTEKDVKQAIFSIDSNKSPCPDGYGSGFYKATWSVIGQEVTNAVLQFFENGKLLQQINSTIISLIPKVENPQNASQFRPISCCNVLYKCISKMICVRLRKVITHVVADSQAAFVEADL